MLILYVFTCFSLTVEETDDDGMVYLTAMSDIMKGNKVDLSFHSIYKIQRRNNYTIFCVWTWYIHIILNSKRVNMKMSASCPFCISWVKFERKTCFWKLTCTVVKCLWISYNKGNTNTLIHQKILGILRCRLDLFLNEFKPIIDTDQQGKIAC